MKKNHTSSGFGISFVLHATILTLILAMGGLIPDPEIPMMIDFSIANEKTKGASVVQKKADKSNNRLVAPSPLVEPAEKKPIRTIQPKTSKTEKQIKPKAVTPVPEEITVVKKEISKPLQEVVAVKKEEPIYAPSEVLQKEIVTGVSQKDIRSLTPQVVENPLSTGKVANTRNSGPQDPSTLYIKAHFEYIKNTIQKQIIYPVVARKKGWQGRVIVSFVVDKDGNVMDITIRESSGFSLLDRSAVKTIKKVAPFPPPPVRAELIVPINYSLV